MLFTQYYLDCLSQASYLIGDESTGQAVVVDPRRDVAEYLADAEARGLRIVGVYVDLAAVWQLDPDHRTRLPWRS